MPFSIVESPRLKAVIELASKTDGGSAGIPGRNAIATNLLDANFKAKRDKTLAVLKGNAETFGISLFSDGATVKKMPLINVLAACPVSGTMQSCTPCVLNIHDCSEHMAKGGKKDATFIAKIVKVEIKALDPGKNLVDFVCFDGASACQVAGNVLRVDYPLISVGHGAEHVGSLFFSDIAKLPPVEKVIRQYRRVYYMFGNGARHGPYAIFMAESQRFNGTSLHLIKASPTRMAGFFYALHRMCRLKQTLEATVACVAFRDLKLGKKDNVSVLIRDKNFWKVAFCLVKAVLPVLKVLRLADRNKPGMDKLHYYVRSANVLLKQSCKFFDEEQDIFDMRVTTNKDPEDIDPEGSDSSDARSQVDSSDDESVESVPYATLDGLGTCMMKVWVKRSEQLSTDFALAGWILSPIPDILQDAMENVSGDDQLKVEDVIARLCSGMVSADLTMGRIQEIF